MHNKKLRKLFTGCALSMALTMAAAPINVFAAEVNSLTPGTTEEEKTAKAAEETKRTVDPTAEDDPSTTGTNEAYTDTEIDVWAFTKEEIVYSVDVEWGAMTFAYEAGSWDPETHETKTGRGWLVYNNSNNEVLDNADAQDAINRVTVTNHSNAAVYAQLSYDSETDFADTTGAFAASDTSKKTETNTAEDYKATFDVTNKLISLETAKNGEGENGKGKPTVGNVYFKPEGIADGKNTADGIAQWTKIGKITVAILTEDPTPATPPAP